MESSNISASCYVDVLSPNYTRHLWDIEKNFDYWWAYFWLLNNWKICYYFIVGYLVAIFAGQHYMKSRPPFELRGALFLWNFALALYSIIASYRVIPEIVYMLQNDGFYATVCSGGTIQHKKAISIWIWLFAYSKILELGDTAFIVLRKTPLIVLHWFHHVTVLFFTFSCSAYPSAIHLYFMAVNVFVHSFMYSYYALKVLRVRIPKKISMAITSIQLLQMIVGVYVTVYGYWAKSQDSSCCLFDRAITIAVGMYVAYFVLFLNFFIKAYLSKKPMFDSKGSTKKIK